MMMNWKCNMQQFIVLNSGYNEKRTPFSKAIGF